MPAFTNPLSNLKVASPCLADWDAMYGNERMRFCGDCKLNVYNLSGMTRDEAESLIINAEGRLCVRFYRRTDGSVITQDCPVGWAKIKQRAGVYAAAVSSLLMALFTGVLFVSLFSKQKPAARYEPLMGVVASAEKGENVPSNAQMIQGNFAIDVPQMHRNIDTKTKKRL